MRASMGRLLTRLPSGAAMLPWPARARRAVDPMRCFHVPVGS